MRCCFTSRSGWLLSLFIALLAMPALAFGGTLAGRVTDPDARPVANATVLILRGQTVVTTARTNADGRFGPLTLDAGTYDIVVAAPGLRHAPAHAALGTDTTVDLALHMDLAAVGESVVVSASSVDALRSRVTDSVTVIDRDTIEAQQIDTVAAALHETPGFSVVASGGRGAVTSLFPRGGESDYTLVLVDGIELNAFGGAFDAAHLPTANVERIEVVRGPQSALYGGGAIGGIVQIVTAGGGHTRGTAEIETGSYATSSSRGTFATSRGPWTFGGGVDWLQSDGVTDTLAAGARVSNDDYSRASGSINVGWSDTAARRIRVDLRGGRNERGFPGPYGSDPEGLYGGIDTVSRGTNEDLAAGLTARFAQGDRVFHHVAATWTRAFGEFLSPPFDPSPAAPPSRTTTGNRRATARYQLDVVLDALPISAGVEWLGERGDNTFITDASFEPVPVERSATGLFVEARPSVAGRLFTTLGLRLERLDRHAFPGDGFSRPAFDSQVIWSANPKLSVAWIAHAGDAGPRPMVGATKLRFSAGTGIKPPTAFEIAFTDNPDLAPERSRSIDAGIEQWLFDGRLAADVTWFHNRYEDLIVSVGQTLAGASRYRTDNIANARARGIEVGASVRPIAGLMVRGAWSWLDTEVLEVDSLPGRAPAPYRVGDRLVRRPRSSGSLDVRWSDGRASAFVSIAGRGSVLDLEPNFASSLYENAGFVNTTIGASLRVHRAIEVFGRVTNAFDRRYEEIFGFPALGRSASIGVRVAAGR